MSQHQHDRSPASRQSGEDYQLAAPAAAGSQAQDQQQAQDASFEELLDQIDAVIERNPEGYVRSFVQRGGQ